MDIVKEQPIVKKANQLITAKYKATATENSIMAVALTRLHPDPNGLRASISGGELTSLLNLDSKNGYRQLKTAAASMTGHVIFIENPDKREFLSFAMITEAEYKKGNLTIIFNPRLTPFLQDLKGRYTSFELHNYLALPTSASQRLYEILKKNAYQITQKNPVVTVVYDLSELKYMLGCFELKPLELEKVKTGKMTWAEAESKVDKASMKRWGNFKTRVLDRAKEEIASKTDICFDYEPYAKIKHGQITQVAFFIRKSIDNIPEEFLAYEGHNGLTKKDIHILSKDAENDFERFKNAIELADNERYVENYVGFLRKAIKENWKSEKITVADGSKERGDRLNAVQKDLFDAQQDPNGEFFVHMWERANERPEINEFFNQFSFQERQYFELYNYREKVEKFFEWKRDKMGMN